MQIANDTKSVAPRFAGRDVHKAIDTVRAAIVAGKFDRARNAARYALARLGIKVAVPTSNSPDVWALVVQTMSATADRMDAEAIRLQSA